MSFDPNNAHNRFDDAFANLVSAWLQADDLRRAGAPIGDRTRATLRLAGARNDARDARQGLGL